MRMPNAASTRGFVPVGLAGLLALVALAALVVVVAALATLCVVAKRTSPEFDRSDFVGTYVAEYKSGTETLTLNADGTFRQEVVLDEPADGGAVTRTGEWVWNDSLQSVVVRNCMPVNDGFSDISEDFRTAGVCFFAPGREWWFFGRIYFGELGTAPLWKVE